MAFKMSGYSAFTKKVEGPGKGDPETKKSEQENPGFNNPQTPDYVYKEDGTRVSTTNIDEGQLGTSTKTDSKGTYALYSDGTKYYFNNPTQ
tara:strand:- start:303 stop:575 length:273 start_codon:yes stop_codon:yes gene_type:complete